MSGSRSAGEEEARKARRRERSKAISLAHHLISNWASCELSEIRKNWYAPSSAGYRYWEPPRDPDTRLERQTFTRNYAEIQLTGWVIYTLRDRSRRAIRKKYLDGGRVGYHALTMALDEFHRSYESWKTFWEPLDPL